MTTLRWRQAWVAVPAAVVVVLGLAACHGSVLDVTNPTITTPGTLTPNSIPDRMNGAVADFHDMFGSYVLYSGLLGDEFILAGTDPGNLAVDERRPDPNGGAVEDVWGPMSVSRASADQMVSDFSSALTDPEFASVKGQLQDGIALGELLGGYDRILFSELFCQSIFGGVDGESGPMLPADRMREAAALLLRAEQASGGSPPVSEAALVGQARAHLFLGEYGAARSLAESVPEGFAYHVEYSTNSFPEYNRVYAIDWGDQTVIRWTVGDGTDATRHNELWPYYADWVSQGLIIPPDQNDLQSFNGASPINLETPYGGSDTDPTAVAPNVRTGLGGAAPIVLASYWEARMIIAEAEYRSGDTAAAASTINSLLTDPAQTDNPIRTVNQNVPFGAFAPVSFNGDLRHDLGEIARARAAGLWLTGERQGTLFRFDTRDGVDFYPVRQGTAIQLPVPRAETDNNPNISNACPAGTPGFSG